jgi:predicted transcriptional regulator
MTVLKPKKRMISLRLSDDEYQKLVSQTANDGAHSTSEIARAALSEFLAKSHAPGDVAHLRARIDNLEGEVQRLNHVLETIASAAKG